MAPKKEKDLSSQIAGMLSMPHEEQVDLLSQALLREYMHRRQYLTTLKTFDEENPRNEKTVSSRGVMTELMHVSPSVASQMKAEGIETIMEMLCAMRVEKATTVHERWQELHRILDLSPPEAPHELVDELKRIEDEISAVKKRVKKLKREKKEAKANVAGQQKPAVAAPKKSKKRDAQSKQGGLLTIEELLEQDDNAKIQKMKEEKEKAAVAASKKKIQAQAVDVISSGALKETPTNADAKKASTASSDTESSSSGDSSSSDSDEDYAAALRKIREEEERALAERQKVKQGWGAVDEPVASDAAASSGSSPKEEKSGGASAHPQQLTVASNITSDPLIGAPLAEQLKLALVGGDRRIPSSFWSQGFFFSKDVPYGLVQNEGGSCGVIAVVQALVLADVFGNHRLVSDDVLKSALTQAFAAMLRHSQGNSRGADLAKVVVVYSNHSHPAARSAKEQISAMATFARKTGFTSAAELEAFLGSRVLKMWMEPKGQGLLCLILSCLMTRGITTVQHDMDVESALVVEHGYCSQELVNLLLAGRATSNVHDGDVQHGELLLKGISQLSAPLEVGFLSYMEHRQIVQVGNLCKTPQYPVWVVNHESHYTTLFMKTDARQHIAAAKDMGFVPPAVFDIFFWDQLGGQDDEIRLTVTLEKTPVPPVGKDTIVPYLNDIIRTVPEWKTGRVAWNGTDPLL